VRTQFGSFIVDSDTRQLLRDGREMHLSPKAFDLLCVLIERRPKVVDKGELHARVWPDTYVVDANLNVLIGEIRRTIDDPPAQQRFVRTVHGIGYAFCGEAADLTGSPAQAPGPRVWLVWKDRTFLLSDGDNIIGRDPNCGVWLDATGVSRQHARIRIDAGTRSVVLSDLDSTNGTFVRGARIATAEPIADGDVITIGSVELKFRAWTADKPPKTERIRRRPR
jgi:DNA-binding winged helix-turn-helix (wHTH) protein